VGEIFARISLIRLDSLTGTTQKGPLHTINHESKAMAIISKSFATQIVCCPIIPFNFSEIHEETGSGAIPPIQLFKTSSTFTNRKTSLATNRRNLFVQ
jgi:hypothetical protein